MEKLIGKKTSQILKSLIIHQNHPTRVKLEVSCNDKEDYDLQDFCKLLDHHSISCKSEISPNNNNNKEHSPQISFANNGRRECYKKRKIDDELREEVVTHLRDDGYAWRKYGQKNINHSDYPRHYYRCTHKNEQNCQATKQIQQISQTPNNFKLKYSGNHTCNNTNIMKTSPYVIDSPEEQHSPAFVLSFDGSNPINPLLFPPSGSSDSCRPPISNPVAEEISIGVGEDNYYSSHHSTPTYLDNFEQDYSFILDDFPDILPDWWTS